MLAENLVHAGESQSGCVFMTGGHRRGAQGGNGAVSGLPRRAAAVAIAWTDGGDNSGRESAVPFRAVAEPEV